jgi:enamine deaminase RidA (YjgF/YER057c/UK114 family)
MNQFQTGNFDLRHAPGSISRLATAAGVAFSLLLMMPLPSNAQDLKRDFLSPTWEAKYTFSPAVITSGGKTVWVAGHVGFVDENNKSLAGNFDAQVRQTFKNIQATLAKAGGSLSDVTTMTVFINDGRFAKRFTELRGEFYPKNYPASTLIVAAGFALPEIMVEITPTAVVK